MSNQTAVYHEGRGLFPLEKIAPRLHGYFMSHDFRIFSARVGGKLRELAGSSSTGSVRYRTFTLAGMSYTGFHLQAQVQNRFGQEFKMMTATLSPVPVVDQSGPLAAGRTHNHKTAVSGRMYVLATIQGDRLVLGAKPVYHSSTVTALQEAERIASNNPGNEIVVLQVINSVKVGGATWTHS